MENDLMENASALKWFFFVIAISAIFAIVKAVELVKKPKKNYYFVDCKKALYQAMFHKKEGRYR